VAAFEPGAFDPDRIPPGSPSLTVNGSPGYYAEIIGPLAEHPLGAADPAPRPSTGPNAARTQVVVWRYADNAWATSSCTRGPSWQASRRDAELVANGTTFEPQRLRVPLKLGYLPAGRHLVSGVLEPRPGLEDDPRFDNVLRLEFIDPDSPSDSHLTISYSAGYRIAATRTEHLTINGRPALFNERSLIIVPDKRIAVTIEAHTGVDDPRAELIRVAEQLEFAPDPADQSTWFDAADALP